MKFLKHLVNVVVVILSSLSIIAVGAPRIADPTSYEQAFGFSQKEPGRTSLRPGSREVVDVSIEGVEIVLQSGTEWVSKQDLQNLRRAKQGCRIYYSNNHKLIRFVKRAELTYHAICRKDSEK